MMKMPSIKFTQKAQNVLNNALNYARKMGHTYVGSEHILMGLVSEEDSVAAKILNERGVAFDKIKSAVEAFAGVGTVSDVTPADMTPRTKRIIEASASEAIRLNQSYIGTEHILLALIAESDCVAVKILEELGIDASVLRQELNNYFGEISKAPQSNMGDGDVKTAKGQKKSNVPLIR